MLDFRFAGRRPHELRDRRDVPKSLDVITVNHIHIPHSTYRPVVYIVVCFITSDVLPWQ